MSLVFLLQRPAIICPCVSLSSEFVFDEAGPSVPFKSCNPAIGLADLPHCRSKVRTRSDILFDRTDISFKARLLLCRLSLTSVLI